MPYELTEKQRKESIEYNRKAKANWEKKKNQLNYVDYFIKLHKTYTDPRKKQVDLSKIDKKELLKNLKLLRENKHKLPIISSSPDDWLPHDVMDSIQWALGSEAFHPIQDTLGFEAVRQRRGDLLETLAKSGDKKAITRKKINTIPKELHNKDLQWIRKDNDEYIVKIKPSKKRTKSKYEKDYELYNTDDLEGY